VFEANELTTDNNLKDVGRMERLTVKELVSVMSKDVLKFEVDAGV